MSYSSAILFGLIAVWYLVVQSSNGPAIMGNTDQAKWRFETVTGFFVQDEPDTSESFDYVSLHHTQLDLC